MPARSEASPFLDPKRASERDLTQEAVRIPHTYFFHAYDWSAFAEGVLLAIEAGKSNKARPHGQKILSTAEEYVRRPLIKSMIPWGLLDYTGPQRQLQPLVPLFADESKREGITAFIADATRRGYYPKLRQVLQAIVSTEKKRGKPENYREHLLGTETFPRAYTNLLDLCMRIPEDTADALYNQPSRIFSYLRQHTPELLEENVGSNERPISITSILSREDVYSFAEEMLGYFACMPLGDVFHQRLASALFLVPPVGVYGKRLMNPVLSRRMIQANEHIGQEVVLPGLETYLNNLEQQGIVGNDDSRVIRNVMEQRGRFDQLFTAALANMDPLNQQRMALIASVAATHARTTNESFGIDELYYQLIYQICQAEALNKRPYQRYDLEDTLVQNLLNRQRPAIMRTARDRFRPDAPNQKAANTFFSELDELLATPAQEQHTGFILKKIEQNVGQQLLERLNRQGNDIQDIIATSIQQALSQFNLFPHTGQEHAISFERLSLPDVMSIQHISFLPVDHHSPINFRVAFSEGKSHMITGFLHLVDENPHITFSANIGETNPGLENLLRLTIATTFADLVQGHLALSPVSQQTPPEGSLRERTVVDEDATDSESPSITRIPRIRGVVRHEYTGVRDAVAGERSSESPLVPRRVGMYTRSMPGGEEYRTALALYGQASAEEQESAEMLLAQARANLGRYSVEKRAFLEGLPNRFRNELEDVVDPVTNEPLNLRTWVVEHFTPRLTEEERRSPQILFNRRYKDSGRPLSGFLNYLTSWIVEGVSETS